ncbi:tetratricopeptide repeat protein [Desulfovibrio mangrovi]|uniref:tetratricopeptide repeat protein n=1 Tax=Desulfovibrio mangrovi TaxID=2976983 RepID=UPI002248177C|nr:tetratricopeptide repeat protein [Desulfovibrio mangrovi]UZP68947.1 tetratricopeptide repeat protein [Desulfovibrio mangrovi]
MTRRTHNKRGLTQNFYIVKGLATEEAQQAEQLRAPKSKNLYIVKTDEETIHKYADTIYDFVDNTGIFLLITTDRNFYTTFKAALSYDLGLEPEFIRLIHDIKRGAELVHLCASRGLTPMIFLQRTIDCELTLSFLQFMKATFPKFPIILISHGVDKHRLYQFYEEGVDSCLAIPTCANEVIKKIASTIKPQNEIQLLLNEGNGMLADRLFEDAIEVANTILLQLPNNSAAHILKGDALKGLMKRIEALESYEKAEKCCQNIIEPCQRIATIHLEDGNWDNALKYLKILDKSAPLNYNRKIKIAQIYMENGTPDAAQSYFDAAIRAAKSEALNNVGEMIMNIADIVLDHDPILAAAYYRQSLRTIKGTNSPLAMNTYNRLGISLRKQGLWSEAVEAYSEAARFAPKDENIQYNMALAFAEGGDFESASGRLANALKLNPELCKNRPETALAMGQIFAKANQTKVALFCLECIPEDNALYGAAATLAQQLTSERT